VELHGDEWKFREMITVIIDIPGYKKTYTE
jgi:hypothetical protein